MQKRKRKIEGKETRRESLKEKWKKEDRKLESLLKWAKEESIAIIGIIETNMTEREGNFLAYSTNKKYKGYWSSAAEEKKKGSDIGILIEDQWEKHVGAVKRVSEYMIEITLFLKQMELVIIGVYMPPNDKIAMKKLQQRIVEVVSKRKNQTQIAIMGDFNHIADNVLDRMHPQTVNYKRLPVFDWLKRQDFRDTEICIQQTRNTHSQMRRPQPELNIYRYLTVWRLGYIKQKLRKQ